MSDFSKVTEVPFFVTHPVLEVQNCLQKCPGKELLTRIFPIELVQLAVLFIVRILCRVIIDHLINLSIEEMLG